MTKKLKEFIFHSRELLPRDVSLMDIEDRTRWFDEERKAHRFKKGDEVVWNLHIDSWFLSNKNLNSYLLFSLLR